jgi:dihydropteroate synthase
MLTHWQLAHGRTLELGRRAVIMGVLNVTPDSFSDGGRFVGRDAALDQARRLADEGAQIIDVGGESTRPGASFVPAGDEAARVLPIVEALAGQGDVLISVDTYKPEVASAAIQAGAHIVNDIWALQHDARMAEVIAQAGAGLVAMHNGRERELLPDVVEDQTFFLGRSLAIARRAGIPDERIVLDPGFGFAKDHDHNLKLMARFEELRGFGLPLLAGTSRKRFVANVSGNDSTDGRDLATAATSVILRMKGAAIFRVHDVARNREVLAMADAVLERERAEGRTGGAA